MWQQGQEEEEVEEEEMIKLTMAMTPRTTTRKAATTRRMLLLLLLMVVAGLARVILARLLRFHQPMPARPMSALSWMPALRLSCTSARASSF
jgi:hypothetical protein